MCTASWLISTYRYMLFWMRHTIFKCLAYIFTPRRQSIQHLTQNWHHKQQQHVHRKGPVFSAGSVNTIADYTHQVNTQCVHWTVILNQWKRLTILHNFILLVPKIQTGIRYRIQQHRTLCSNSTGGYVLGPGGFVQLCHWQGGSDPGGLCPPIAISSTCPCHALCLTFFLSV